MQLFFIIVLEPRTRVNLAGKQVVFVPDIFLSAILALFFTAVSSMMAMVYFRDTNCVGKALMFALAAALVSYGTPASGVIPVFPHFLYYVAGYFGGWWSLVLAFIGGQGMAFGYGNPPVGLGVSAVVAGLWGLTNHHMDAPRKWQMALAGLWPAAVLLVSPRQSAVEPLLSALGMALVVVMCWYVSNRGMRILSMARFLESAGLVMLIDDARSIVFESPALMADETLARSMRWELVKARMAGLGNEGFAEKEITVTPGGQRRDFLLKLSRVALPLGENGHIAVFRDLTAVKRLQGQVKQFFELAFHGFMVLGATGKILRSNRALAQMLGVAESDLYGKHFQDYVSPIDVPALLEVWNSPVNESQVLEKGTCRLQRVAGDELWVAWSSQPVPFRNEWHVVVRDIHHEVKSKEASQRQIEQGRRMVQLLGLVQEAILVYDEDGSLLYGNAAAEQLYGIEAKELRGVNIFELLPTSYPAPLSTIKDTLNRRGSWQGEITRLTQDGRQIVVEIRLALSTIGTYPIEIIEVGTDITHSREHNRRSKLLAAIVRSTDDAVFSVSPEGVIETWNEGAARLFGVALNEVQGKSLQHLVKPETVKELSAALLQASGGVRVENYRDILPHKNGREVYTRATIAPLFDEEGQVKALSIIARNETEQRVIERETLKIDRLKVSGQVAASIGHELRNSLATVRGFLQLFRDHPDFFGVQTQLNIVLEDLYSANQVASSFLTLAQDKTEIKNLSSLNVIVKRVGERLLPEALARAQVIELKLHVAEPLCLQVSAVEQLVANLARNGLQAMTTGGVLTIKTEQTSRVVLLQVSDCGAGIAPGVADKVWTPFFTTRSGHAGLGLCVCASIAQMHGAKINFVTSPWGTTFTVAFPRTSKGEEGELCS